MRFADKWLFAVRLVACLLGLAASLVLLLLPEGQAPSWACPAGGGCQALAVSPKSVFLGLPLAFWGALYWLAALAFVVMAEGNNGDSSWREALSFSSCLGVVFSLGLVWSQYVLGAWCPLCLASAASTFVLAATVLIDPWRKIHENQAA